MALTGRFSAMILHGLKTSFLGTVPTKVLALILGWVGWFVLMEVAMSQDDSYDTATHDQPELAINRCRECHASTVDDAPPWQRTFRVWYDDPHAQAYTKLLNADSQRIVERLTGTNMAVDSPEYRSVLRDQCVACHANEQASDSQIKLGIDCQVCHGPASAWGDEHYKKATIDRGSQRFEGSLRVNLESLEERARVCSSCHVGRLNRGNGLRDREVNHRLMAAGHPMTYFDFENYLERYPKHWDVAAEDERLGKFPDYERWRLGKWGVAKVRLELLRDRAQRADSASTIASSNPHDWPEFTEYSCTGCHYPLASESWRQQVRSSNAYSWDEWYLEGFELALPDASDQQFLQPWRAAYSALRNNMSSRHPDASIILNQSQTMIGLCQSAMEGSAKPDESVIREELRRLLDEEVKVTSWEQAAQWANTARVLAKSLGWKEGDELIEGAPAGGFFGAPRRWNPLIEIPPYDRYDWFRPGTLSKYRQSLQQQLGPKP